MRNNAAVIILLHVLPTVFDKYANWFMEHPNQDFVYWTADDNPPITYEERLNKKLLEARLGNDKEAINDILDDDHTIVRQGINENQIIMSQFCPRIIALLDEYCIGAKTVTVSKLNFDYEISREVDRHARKNYKVVMTKVI